MPNATVRANAQALPEATPHPDAAIFALAKKCKESDERRGKLTEACDAAETKRRRVETPRAVYKTDADAKIQLFTDGGIGSVYRYDEINRIRTLCRTCARAPASLTTIPVYRRGLEILTAWGHWRAEVDAEEARTGVAGVRDALAEASGDGDILAEQMASLSASTLDGLLAKAAALQKHLPPVEDISDKIREDVLLYGFDQEALALSLARDVLALAQGVEATR